MERQVTFVTIMEKTYSAAPAIIWNMVADIVEMRKGKVTRNDNASMTLETEMYGILTKYVFRVAHSTAEAKVTVETDGKSAEDLRGVQLMFSTLDNMLGSFIE
jgi:hypothetical protein